MSLIDLAQAKLHLRVDGVADDSMIQVYLDAAEESAAQYLGRTIYADETAQGSDTAGIVINAPIRAAILLQCGHLYEHREAVSDKPTSALAMGVQYLLDPFRSSLGV